MDENVINAIRELAKQVSKVFADLANEIQKVICDCSDISDEINRILSGRVKERKKIKKDRSKYKCQIIRPLLLDKRKKVHRCRNNC